jgi:hypothetical protein
MSQKLFLEATIGALQTIQEDSGDSFRHSGGSPKDMPDAGDKAAQHFNKHDSDHEMITSHQHEHSAALPNKGMYAVHNTKTGQTQTFPEPSKKLSKRAFAAHMKKHGVTVQHPETAHHLHQDHLIQHLD